MKRHLIRMIAFALSAALLISVLTGCSLGGVKQTNETLTIWLDDPVWQQNYLTALGKFKFSHPDVEVNFAGTSAPKNNLEN